MKPKIALMGAGGKMGCRITDNMKELPEYEMFYVEVGEAGIQRLRERGVAPTPEEEALAAADAVVLAVPDALIGRISAGIVPKLKSGAMVIGLDPAAAYAGVMPERKDVTYFVTHPCHPPIFGEGDDPDNKPGDWFGGHKAKQSVVSALFQGPEEDYAKGEAIAKAMYAPILRSHRLTVEQMAILEPGVVETTMATLLSTIHETMEEAIRMGVPEEAARDFVYGHIRIEIAIIFGIAGFPFSDGAKLAVEQAKKKLLRDDWKDVMKIENIQQSVKDITHAEG